MQLGIGVSQIGAAPLVSPLSDVRILRDAQDFSVPISVSDEGEDAGALELSVNSSNPETVSSPGLVLSGAGIAWELAIVPEPGKTGTTEITVTVRNQLDETDSQSFTVVVEEEPPNQPPSFSLQPSTIAHPGTLYQFSAEVLDPDDNNVIIRAVVLPSWLQLDPDTRLLQGMVPVDARETVTVILEADDGHQPQPVRLEFNLYIEDIIELGSFADIEAKRTSLINYIWGESGWPTSRSVTDVLEYHGREYNSIRWPAGNLDKIYRYTVEMDYGIKSYIYHLVPKVSNGRLFIYHSGHNAGFMAEDLMINANGPESESPIPRLLGRGFAVIGISMPVYGYYRNPTVETEQFGSVTLRNHGDLFRYLDRPFRFFLEPVAVALNYCEEHFSYDSIYMMGLSGGGWTTTIYAALDPRIKGSFPVAGSVPNYLRVGLEGLGDEEQDDPGFYHIANYSELYVMGAAGPGRTQLQILNRYDSCCFYGARHTNWVDKVTGAVRGLESGNYRFFLDESHQEHKISPLATDLILQSLPPVGIISTASIAEQTINEEQLLEIKVPALNTDSPSEKLSYILTIAPAGAQLDPVAGVFTWTPAEDQGPSTNLFTVLVRDAGEPPLAATNQFTVIVTEVNLPPVLAPLPNQFEVPGGRFSTRIVATDPDLPVNRLSYELREAPAGVILNADTGDLIWLVPNDQPISTNLVVLAVKDDGAPPQETIAGFEIVVHAAFELRIKNEQGQTLLSWNATMGALYDLESTPVLAGSWLKIAEITATGPLCTITDEEGIEGPARYYRLRRLR